MAKLQDPIFQINDFPLFSFFLHFFFRFHLHFGHIFLLCCIYQQNEKLILNKEAASAVFGVDQLRLNTTVPRTVYHIKACKHLRLQTLYLSGGSGSNKLSSGRFLPET